MRNREIVRTMKMVFEHTYRRALERNDPIMIFFPSIPGTVDRVSRTMKAESQGNEYPSKSRKFGEKSNQT